MCNRIPHQSSPAAMTISTNAITLLNELIAQLNAILLA
jgi:hypothetical protein